ncbi:MAG: hypothetical protein LBM73_03000 [Candidatus Nomurabacteria bacterium]|jgi:hypothetical protein|nr:hypothetical protein [Candidatus Nomurabacteria bacterium]
MAGGPEIPRVGKGRKYLSPDDNWPDSEPVLEHPDWDRRAVVNSDWDEWLACQVELGYLKRAEIEKDSEQSWHKKAVDDAAENRTIEQLWRDQYRDYLGYEPDVVVPTTGENLQAAAEHNAAKKRALERRADYWKAYRALKRVAANAGKAESDVLKLKPDGSKTVEIISDVKSKPAGRGYQGSRPPRPNWPDRMLARAARRAGANEERAAEFKSELRVWPKHVDPDKPETAKPTDLSVGELVIDHDDDHHKGSRPTTRWQILQKSPQPSRPSTPRPDKVPAATIYAGSWAGDGLGNPRLPNHKGKDKGRKVSPIRIVMKKKKRK